MKKDTNNHSHNHRRKGSGRTVAVLSCVALVLVVLIALMLFNLPEEAPEAVETTEAPTTAATTAAPTTETTEPDATETTVPEETKPMLENMAELYEKNPDVVGWVKIAGTKLDYPVMFTPEDEEKYIRTSFEGKFSIAGEPFINKDCSLDPRSDNLIIYGHNMYNGTAFHTLMKYDQKTFWEKHPTFTFSTLYEEKTYEIFAAFYDRVYLRSENVFKFYNFIDAEDEADFDYSVKKLKEKSLYDIDITPEYGDKLVTLVTCAYHVDDGRFVLVGREVTEDTAE